jgi:hypothetical protein
MPIVSINGVSPRPQRQDDDPLSTIFKGLQIANQLVDIPVNLAAMKKANAEAELAAKKMAGGGYDKLELAKAGLQVGADGNLTQDDRSKQKETNAQVKELSESIRQGYSAVGSLAQHGKRAPGLENDLKRQESLLATLTGSKSGPQFGGQMLVADSGFTNPNSPKGRYEKTPGDIKQKVGFITEGLQNLTDYENEFSKGGRQRWVTPQTPLIGGVVSAQPIDHARTNMVEAIGRLESGGAIGKEEAKSFVSMLPTAADTDEAAIRALSNVRRAMENKLVGYGYNVADLPSIGGGFDLEKMGYDKAGAPRFALKPGGGGVPGVDTANAAGPKQSLYQQYLQKQKAKKGP